MSRIEIMPFARLSSCGWRRDLPDHRDYTPQHEAVRELLAPLPGGVGASMAPPAQVDWREYCGPIDDQRQLASGATHAGLALVEYFERRASGLWIRPSRLFVYKTARRLSNELGDQGTTLRATWKALARFGAPPETCWPYDAERFDDEPDGFAYGFDREYEAIRYVRLDAAHQTGEQTLQQVKTFLAAGFSCALGFPVSHAVTHDAAIAFPTRFDPLLAGHAVAAVGYDDTLRIRSDKGALLVRNSWGPDWGHAGYGWLPYAYVRQRLAADFWTLLKPEWLASGEFELPAAL